MTAIPYLGISNSVHPCVDECPNQCLKYNTSYRAALQIPIFSDNMLLTTQAHPCHIVHAS